MRDVTLLIIVAGIFAMLFYALLRPLQVTLKLAEERMDELSAALQAVRTFQDADFVLAARRGAPSPMERHFRVFLLPTKSLETLFTASELQMLKDQAVSIPEIAIEEWRTHTVVECQYFRGALRHTDKTLIFETDPSRNLTLWEARLGENADWPLLSPRLEIQFDTRKRMLTFGALLGRFGVRDQYDHLLPTNEFLFATITVTTDALAVSRVSPDADDPPAASRDPWVYSCQSPRDQTVLWEVKVREIEKYDQSMFHSVVS